MLHKVFPDKEKAKSILKMALGRKEFLSSTKISYVNIVVETYYEIIKELSSALLLLNGFKTVGENAHKELIDSLFKFASFNGNDVSILQDLRTKRNRSLYYGKPINKNYITNYKLYFEQTINKLKRLVENKLE